MSQRSVGLAFEPTTLGNHYNVIMEDVNKNVAPPGMYMLFVLRLKEASLSLETMIPSVARLVLLSDS